MVCWKFEKRVAIGICHATRRSVYCKLSCGKSEKRIAIGIGHATRRSAYCKRIAQENKFPAAGLAGVALLGIGPVGRRAHAT
jgi:hypothetical protein